VKSPRADGACDRQDFEQGGECLSGSTAGAAFLCNSKAIAVARRGRGTSLESLSACS
jgi:hypothetical protein